MILNIWDSLNKFSNDINKFIERHYDEPFFWITLFVVLLVIAVTTITKLGDK